MYSFITQGNAGSSDYYGNEIYENVNNEVLKKIYDMVFNQCSIETELKINMPNAYSPYQKLQSSAEPTILIKKKIDAYLYLRKQIIGNNTYFNWNIYSNVDNTENSGLEFINPEPFIYLVSLIILVIGVIVGMIGSGHAVRKHLKI